MAFRAAYQNRYPTVTFIAVIFTVVMNLLPVAVSAQTPVLRVNVGGSSQGALDGGISWDVDTSASPSPYHNSGSNTAGFTGGGLDGSVPPSTPEVIFDTERWDPVTAPEMAWEFPLAAAWVSITQVVTDGRLSLEFVHGLQDPAVKGIEVVDVTNVVSAVDEDDRIPSRFALLGAYPNPFNPSTSIAFELPSSTTVSLGIYDLRGRLVRRLVEGTLPAGRHDIVWDGRDRGGRTVGSGIYLYRFLAGDLHETRKIMLVK